MSFQRVAEGQQSHQPLASVAHEVLEYEPEQARCQDKMEAVLEERMVNVKKGTLVTCDPAMKQFLLHLDETRALGISFLSPLGCVRE